MPEVTGQDSNAWFLKDDDTAIAYMCGSDFQHEILISATGTNIYPSEAALRRNKSCSDTCGIVQVEVKLRKWVVPQDFSKARKPNG